jgi:hypothetical protein
LYTNRSSFAQSARFSRPGAALSIMANVMQEKITLYLPYATGSRSSSLYLSFWNENLADCAKDDRFVYSFSIDIEMSDWGRRTCMDIAGIWIFIFLIIFFRQIFRQLSLK